MILYHHLTKVNTLYAIDDDDDDAELWKALVI